jgi:hypothetical protein
MKEKKHIDRLFQEGFKDFEVAPSDTVWQNIETKLNQNKKKRRVIPIWWRYAGVAALLLVSLTIGREYFKNEDLVVPSNQIVNTKEESSIKSEKSKNENDSIENNDANKVSNNDSEDLKNSITSQPAKSHQTTIISNNSSQKSNFKNKTNGFTNKNQVSEIKTKTNEANVASNNSNEKSFIKNENKEAISEMNKSDEILNSTKNNASLIAENSKQEENPLINKPSENNKMSIEEAIAETKKEDEDKNMNKWSIATNAAPVYFNSLGKGSSLDAQFNDNAKNGEVTMSYGVSASYAINNKLSIRSGINKVNLGYNTNNVVVFESVGIQSNTSALRNINTSDNPDISLISGESLNAASNETFIKTSNTSINQSLGYIEIPLEIEYAIINKKIGFNVIGGFSSFILSSNELFSEFEGQRTKIGEATNLNKVSYSANLGLGLNYKITKKLDLNLEPLFKYQINTFNNTSGDFKPYFIGVYTGIGFKF